MAISFGSIVDGVYRNLDKYTSPQEFTLLLNVATEKQIILSEKDISAASRLKKLGLLNIDEAQRLEINGTRLKKYLQNLSQLEQQP